MSTLSDPKVPTAKLELAGHVAVVTGANHGIGAASAHSLASAGADVLITFLRIDDPADPVLPDDYHRHRAADADAVLTTIEPLPGRAVAVEADLTDDTVVPRLFDEAEARLGPVDILVNNASGWFADTFAPSTTDRIGRRLEPVSPATIDRNSRPPPGSARF